MKTIVSQPNLAEPLRDAVLDEVTSGQRATGERIIQEQIAQAPGVTRQPVQQALLLDQEHVHHMLYDLRAVIEGLACRQAAQCNAERAAKLGPALATHLSCTQRVMGEVLIRDETPRDIWDQHADILDPICQGDGDRAEALARKPITQACGFMVARPRDRSTGAVG